tara:strand:+ start:174 stop:329 length:156 start_codon:yes stop_codon:yes gene_type:complete
VIAATDWQKCLPASDKRPEAVYERTRFPQNNLTVTAAMSGYPGVKRIEAMP